MSSDPARWPRHEARGLDANAIASRVEALGAEITAMSDGDLLVLGLLKETSSS